MRMYECRFQPANDGDIQEWSEIAANSPAQAAEHFILNGCDEGFGFDDTYYIEVRKRGSKKWRVLTMAAEISFRCDSETEDFS